MDPGELGPRRLSPSQEDMGNVKAQRRESQLWAGGSVWRGPGSTLTLGVGERLLTFANQHVYDLVSRSWTW